MNSKELEKASDLIENVGGDPIANFNATFNLKLFRVCLIDDSKVIALSETGDPFQDFELSEIIVEIKDLDLKFDSYDEDNIKN